VTRALRPKATAALAVVPILITDRNAAATVGLEPRELRELVADLGVRHVRRGHRLLVRPEDLLSAIDKIAEKQPSRSEAIAVQVHDEEPQPETADDFLRSIGRRRTA
jgi:hypothetical protein